MDPFIQGLLGAEKEAVTKVMAFMSYNPSIGRVLEKGGVRKFQKIMKGIDSALSRIRNRKDFDKYHHHIVSKVISKIKTNRATRPSYGQAQKPVNVFFKVYIDWARKPNEKIRARLLPYLHVPLDSILDLPPFYVPPSVLRFSCCYGYLGV